MKRNREFLIHLLSASLYKFNIFVKFQQNLSRRSNDIVFIQIIRMRSNRCMTQTIVTNKAKSKICGSFPSHNQSFVDTTWYLSTLCALQIKNACICARMRGLFLPRVYLISKFRILSAINNVF